MNYLAVVLIFVIVIILYMIYSYATNNSLTSGLQKLNEPVTKASNKLDKPGSITYSYQGWFFITSNTQNPTALFKRKSDGAGNSDFEVTLTGTTLKINAGQGGSNAPRTIMTVTDQFPLQKWVYLVINVFSTGTLEAYMNGKLVKTVNTSENIKPRALSPIMIGHTSLSGYVTKFTRLPITLDAQTIQTNYYNGNGISSIFSSMVPYGLNLTISKGEDLQRSITVF